MPRPHCSFPGSNVSTAELGILSSNIELVVPNVASPPVSSTIVDPQDSERGQHRCHSHISNASAAAAVATSIEHRGGALSSSPTSSDSSGFGEGISVSPACNDLPACFGHKVSSGAIENVVSSSPSCVRTTSGPARAHPFGGIFRDEDCGEDAGSLQSGGAQTHSNRSFETPNKASWSSSPPAFIVASAEGASPLRCSSPNHQLPCFTANIPSHHASQPTYSVLHHVGSSNHHSSSTATANGSEAGIRFLLRKSALTSSTVTVSGSTPSTMPNNNNGGSAPMSPPHIVEYPSPESHAHTDGLAHDDTLEDDDELMPMLARCLSPNPHSPTAIPHPNFSSSVDDFGPKPTGMHLNGSGDSPASIPVSSRHFQSFLSFPHVSSKASSTTSSAAPEFSQLLSKFAERGHYGGSPSPRASGLHQHTSPNLMRYTFSEGVISRRNSIPPSSTSNNTSSTNNNNTHIYHPHPHHHDGVKRGRAKGVTEGRRRTPGNNAFLSAAAVQHTVRGPSNPRVPHLFNGNINSDTLSESTPAETDVKLPAFQQCPTQKMRVTTSLHRFAATTPTFYSSDSAKITSFYASGANGVVRGPIPSNPTKPNQMDVLGFGTTVCSSHNPGSPRDLSSPQSPPRPPISMVGGGDVSSPLRQAGIQGSGEGSGYSVVIDGVVHHLPMDIRLPDASARSSSDSLSTHEGTDVQTGTCDTTSSGTGNGTAQSHQHMEGWGHHAFATSASTPLQSILDSNPSSTRSPAGRVNVDAGFGRRLGLQVPAGLFQALAKANITTGGQNTIGSTPSGCGGGTAGSPSLSLHLQDGGPGSPSGHNNETRCSILSSHLPDSRHSIPSDVGRAAEDLHQSIEDDWGSGSQEMANDGGLRTLFALPQHHTQLQHHHSPPASGKRPLVTRVDEDTSPLTKYGRKPSRSAGASGSGWSVSSSTEASGMDPASSSTIPTSAIQGGSTTSDRWWGNSGSVGGNTFLDFSLHNSLANRPLANQPRIRSPPPPPPVSMIPKPLPLSRPVHLDVSPRGRGGGDFGEDMMEDSSVGEHRMSSLFTVVSSQSNPSIDHTTIPNSNQHTAPRGVSPGTGSPSGGAAARPRGVLPAMSTVNPTGRPLPSYNMGRFGGAQGSMHLSGSIGPNFFNVPSNPNNNSSTGFNGSLPVFAGLSGRHPDSTRSTKSSTTK